MKTGKLSLSGIKNMLSRDEMKKIMAGSSCNGWFYCTKCCTPDYSLCGQCNSIAGGCQGNGVLVSC